MLSRAAPKPAPPCRRRTSRPTPTHVALERLQLAVERLQLTLDGQRLRGGVDGVALDAALRRVWVEGLPYWTVAELRERGLLGHGTDTRAIGQALAQLADSGQTFGPWRIEREDLGAAKKQSDGRLWRLTRM